MRYISIVSLFIVTNCGPLGDDIASSWECMNGGGSEYCEPESATTEETETTSEPGASGPAGDPGIPGVDGVDGRDGRDCTVVQLESGVRVECSDGTSAVISNGTAGTDGVDGADGTSCTVSQYTSHGNKQYVTISCPDGTSVTFRSK
jgi:hypothetical protein